MSFSQITVVGNVGKDPEIRHLGDGSLVANFSIAVNDKVTYNGETKQTTHWFQVDVWQDGERKSGLVDVVQKYVVKGAQLLVQGRPIIRKYQDRDGNDRQAFSIRLSGPSAQLRLLGGTRAGDAERGREQVDPETGEVTQSSRPANGASGKAPQDAERGEAFGRSAAAARNGRANRSYFDDDVPF